VIVWFRRNARDLPWRRTTDPYAILVSEIMCQQTQVATVIPYFERWMRRFPDFRTLAAAPEPDVMSLWQGLGYYSRARNLHRAAQALAEAGAFPRDPAAIRALPGVGPYTAGAVAAFAYDAPVPLVDANIARVLARVFGVWEEIGGPGLKRVWQLAAALQPSRGGRAFNGGLMELGAVICAPRRPNCPACPVARHCMAAKAGLQETFPVKKARRKVVRIEERSALIVRAGKVLLEKQTGPRWKGLWKLPALETIPQSAPQLVIEYPFTHHKVRLSLYRRPPPRPPRSGCEWHPVAMIAHVPMAAGHRRALNQILNHERNKVPTD